MDYKKLTKLLEDKFNFIDVKITRLSAEIAKNNAEIRELRDENNAEIRDLRGELTRNSAEIRDLKDWLGEQLGEINLKLDANQDKFLNFDKRIQRFEQKTAA